jgi:polyferredoxin
MNLSNMELPSNKRFGFFFSGVFFIASAYFHLEESVAASYSFATLGLLLLIVTIIKADVLLPLNRLWMQFGLLLGMIVSPIVLGVIFFGLFTPISLVTRLFGRDELRLRFEKKNSHWISRDSSNTQSNTFKNQF